MAIVGFVETGMFFGTINTSASASSQHNFASPLTLWSRPYIQSFFNNSSDGSVSLGVSQFQDNTGSHNVNFHPGVFASNCTSVTFLMSTRDCIAQAVLTTEIFG